MSRRGGRPGTRAGGGDGDWVENALSGGRLGEIWCWAALAPADPLQASATCGILAKDGDFVLFPTDEVVKDTQPEDDRQLASQVSSRWYWPGHTPPCHGADPAGSTLPASPFQPATPGCVTLPLTLLRRSGVTFKRAAWCKG